MNEVLLIKTKTESKVEILSNLSNFFILNQKYQKLLFITFSIAIYTTSLVMVNFPSQKTIPDYKCIEKSEEKNSLNNLKEFLNLPKHKIIKEKSCIRKYCNSKKSPNSKTEFTGIIVDYTTITNFITIFDAFCDYDDFFMNLNFLINFFRIIGNTLMGYLSDQYGRKISYYLHYYIMIFFYIGIFFISNRIFFYLFVIFTSINIQFFQLLQIYSNETMTQKNFSLYSSMSSVIYTVNGLVCMLVMVFMKNVYFIYFIQLNFVLLSFILSRRYVKETFPFLIKKKKFERCLNDIKELNVNLDLKIKEDAKFNKILNEAEEIISKEKYKKKQIYSDFKSPYLTENADEETDFSKDLNIKGKPKRKNSFFGPFEIIFSSKENLYKLGKFLILFLSIFMIYYGCTFNVEIIFDNIYIATAIFFSAEFLGQFICCYTLPYSGRISSMKICFGLSAIIFLLISLMGDEYVTLKLILFYFGILLISFNLTVIYILTTESFEVEIKNTVMSLLTNISCVFLMIFPKIIKIFPNISIIFSLSCLLSFYVLGDIKETYK